MSSITKLIPKFSFVFVLVAICGTQCCPPPGGPVEKETTHNLVVPASINYSILC